MITTIPLVRILVPLDCSKYEPIFVNAKQYKAILRRRRQRAKIQPQNKLKNPRKVCYLARSYIYGLFPSFFSHDWRRPCDWTVASLNSTCRCSLICTNRGIFMRWEGLEELVEDSLRQGKLKTKSLIIRLMQEVDSSLYNLNYIY